MPGVANSNRNVLIFVRWLPIRDRNVCVVIALFPPPRARCSVRRPARHSTRETAMKLYPKSKVPTLQKDDGSVLTEFPAIATWLARKNPDKNLLPSDADGEARALEAMDYV